MYSSFVFITNHNVTNGSISIKNWNLKVIWKYFYNLPTCNNSHTSQWADDSWWTSWIEPTHSLLLFSSVSFFTSTCQTAFGTHFSLETPFKGSTSHYNRPHQGLKTVQQRGMDTMKAKSCHFRGYWSSELFRVPAVQKQVHGTWIYSENPNHASII